MLDDKDSATVRTWLEQALLAAGKRGLTKADLARHCGVTAQAVDGWLRTGRITKSNLARASMFFGHSPSFTGNAVLVREAAVGSAWPFRKVSQSEIEALSVQRLARLDTMVRQRLDEWAEDDELSGATLAKRRS